MTNEQQIKVDEFNARLETQIIDYLSWGIRRCLNVIYYELKEIVYLLAVGPDDVSNDGAGIHRHLEYFQIEKDGKCEYIQPIIFQEKRNLATEIFRTNKDA